MSDKMSISGGRELGFDLEHVYVLLMQKNRGKTTTVAAVVLQRIDRTLEARRASR